ncbi:hypothetical protein EOPP23_16935 [Endozoicomonas sp. OPT23]|uniref:hypothetical protein n=1 Tax=Endozoicomonas sp. OPT23 TaxID=2072845 RepID=UPI00129BF3F3|nr:hypothetical protein [Endozoicomonas sp. OPT23]MRI34671.1 hypothetical protein [Endozoicomonas sp. OPT23]
MTFGVNQDMYKGTTCLQEEKTKYWSPSQDHKGRVPCSLGAGDVTRCYIGLNCKQVEEDGRMYFVPLDYKEGAE